MIWITQDSTICACRDSLLLVLSWYCFQYTELHISLLGTSPIFHSYWWVCRNFGACDLWVGAASPGCYSSWDKTSSLGARPFSQSNFCPFCIVANWCSLICTWYFPSSFEISQLASSRWSHLSTGILCFCAGQISLSWSSLSDSQICLGVSVLVEMCVCWSKRFMGDCPITIVVSCVSVNCPYWSTK